MKRKFLNILFVLFFLNTSIIGVCSSEDIFDIETDVLIVGAGPAGLTLANICQKNNVDYLLVEKNSTFNTYSKATGIHVNSMKIFFELGLAKELLNAGIRLDGSTIVHNGEIIQETEFNHGLLPHELNLSISQQKLEEILINPLQKSQILHSSELKDFYESNGSIYFSLKDNDSAKERKAKSKFLAAADGAKSLVRKKLGLTFEGESTPELSFSFDASITDSNYKIDPHKMYMFSNDEGRIVIVPINRNNVYKISGKLPFSESNNVSLEKLQEIIFDRSRIKIDKESITGKVFYHTHSRIASNFSSGKVFLLGDAAHVFYPAGGYGLNVAVEDALVLGNNFSNFLKFGDMTELEQYSSKRKEVALLVQKDSINKKTISMDMTKKEKLQEKQVYLLK